MVANDVEKGNKERNQEVERKVQISSVQFAHRNFIPKWKTAHNYLQIDG